MKSGLRFSLIVAAAAVLAGLPLAPSPAQDSAPAPTTPPAGNAPAPAPDAPKPVVRPTATVTTDKGVIVIELYPEDAPETVANFVKLAKSGFYDGLTFHRVVPGFVIQGGDPKGDGTGDPGYKIKHEKNKKLKHTVGAVAMANAGRDTAGSQFYVVITKPAPFLDDTFADGMSKYTIFGRVASGQDVAEKIAVGDKMTKVTIAEPPPGSEPPKPEPEKTPDRAAAEPRLMVPVIVPYLDRPIQPKSTKPKAKVTVAEDGRVTKVELKSKTGVPELDKAVTDALARWVWLPATKDGKAVKSDRTFVYDIVNRSVRYE